MSIPMAHPPWVKVEVGRMNEVLLNAVLVLCALAGISLLIGVLLLLAKRIIVLDHETKQPMEFEFPVLGKVKTQSPVIALAIIGALLIAYSVHERRLSLEEVRIEGDVDAGGKTVTFVVVAVPKYQFSINTFSANRAIGPTPYAQPVPLIPDSTLRVLMYVDQTIIDDQVAEPKSGKVRLRAVRYEPVPQEFGIAPRPSQ